MKTVLIMSRRRLAPMFKAMAAELARDHRVIVAINILWPNQETHLWQDFKEGTVIDFYARMQETMGSPERWSAPFINRIEEETGVTLYKSTSNFQLYRRLFKSYTGHWPWESFYAVEKEVIREYAGSYLVLTDIFDKFTPDVIFYETVDLISTFMALALAYNRGKFSLGFNIASAFEKIKIFLPYGTHRRNIILEKLFRDPDLIGEEARQMARELISRLNQEKVANPWYVQVYNKAVKKPLYRNPRLMLQKFRNRATRPHPLRYLRTLKNHVWLEAHSRKGIPGEPYIAFFLQHQPEASLCSCAPRWIDQDRIIEQLAINAPYGLKIVIKENPRTYGSRGKNYFGPLLDIPNVHMCHPAVSTFEVIQGAAAILAITGSTGLEGIIMGKRVAVLGHPYYSIYPGIKKLHYPDEIFAALRDDSWQPRNLAQERETFTAAHLASLHDFGPVPPGQVWPPPQVGGPQLAQALRRTLAVIETHNLKPADFDPGIRRESPK